MKDGEVVETPLLLPSFSSKTFQDEKVAKIIQFTARAITEGILISAYDLFYGEITKKISFPSLIFLDSGGYEASEDVDLSDPGKKPHRPKRWRQEQHNKVLSRWNFDPATVIVSFDSPHAKTSVDRQIKRAKKLFDEFPQGSSEILFKTERKSEELLNIDEIVAHKRDLTAFDIVGVTEKELGESTLDRMINIAKLRNALISIDSEMPIHVFGSLDTVSTALYFFAGADVFDGLTWLRYAFHEGTTIYKHNYGAQRLGISFEDFRVNGKVWNDNYYYLLELKQDMEKFLLHHDFNEFRYNRKLFKTAYTQFEEKWEHL